MKSIISIWMQPVYARSNSGDQRLFWFLLGLLPLTCIVIAFMKEAFSLKVLAVATLIGLGAAALILYLVWFMLLTVYAMQQYTPANARLIPNFKRHMMSAFSIPIAVSALLTAIAVSYNGKSSFGLAWIFTITTCLLWTSIIRSNAWLFLLPAGGFIPHFVERAGYSASFSEMADSIDHPFALIPTGLLLLPAGLHWIFSLHRDPHFSRKKTQEQYQVAMDSGANSIAYSSGLSGRSYHYLLNKNLRKNSSLVRLLPFCFGPGLHWSTMLLQISIFGCLAALFVVAAIHLEAPDMDDRQLYWFGLFPFLSLLFFAGTAVVPTMLYQTRNEQGLLSLGELSPAPQAFKREVFAYFLRHYAILWIACLLAAIFTAEFMDVARWARDGIYLICFALLPLTANVLANHAAMQGPQESRALRIVAVSFAFVLASLKLMYDFPAIRIEYLCALMAIGSAGFLMLRWRNLMRQGATFPAGRSA